MRVAFVLHEMQVAGAEMLVKQTIDHLGAAIEPTVLCLDRVGALGEELRGQGVTVTAYGRREGRDWALARRMARSFRARRVQVVHAHQYTPFFYSALANVLTRNRPGLIFTEHGRHYPDVVGRARRLANRLVLSRCADDVNAVCEFSAKALRSIDGFGARQVGVIENGIDPHRYGRPANLAQAKTRVGFASDRRHIICIARFHPVKDHATLIAAFAKLAGARPDVDLVLVGDGPERSAREADVLRLGLSQRVIFTGVRSDVADLLAAADVFTLTSVSEAASLTLLEAMASGLPAVVSDVGGNPEIVRDGADGLLAGRGAADAFAAAFTRLLDDPALASRMGASGATRVREHYDLRRTLDRYAALYRHFSRASR
jgi:glycosyltransferase involved in cell wall biosynthesis